MMARGLAASELAERGDSSTLNTWVASLEAEDEVIRLRLLFELALLSRTLRSPITSEALLKATRGSESNDLTQATCLAAAMENRTESALSTWQRLMEGTEKIGIRGDLAQLALDTRMPMTEGAVTTLREGPPIHQAMAELLLIPPDSRLAAAQDLVNRGHLATMGWVLREADDRDDPAAEEAIAMVLDAGLSSSRSAAAPIASMAANMLARRNPQALADRVAELEDPRSRFVLLRALARSGARDAPAAVKTIPPQETLALESLALLALARGGELDDQQLRKLGRAAAGGGRLPSDLRAHAAWIYLDRSDKLAVAIPRLVLP